MISYTSRPDGLREIDRVSLSDIEDAARVKKGEGIYFQVGNVFWRSPEAQTGTRVGKASDVWSFGVTVIAPSVCSPARILCSREWFLLIRVLVIFTGCLRYYQNGHLRI